jgi:hypothetical protein
MLTPRISIMASRSNAASRSGSPAAGAEAVSPSSNPPRGADLEKAIQAVVKRIKEVSRDTHHTAAIEAHWELGRVLAMLRGSQSSNDQAGGTDQGRMGSIRLARRLQLRPTQIKIAGYIFQAYPTPADRDRILEMRRADGSPLKLSLLSRLCFPTLKSERERLLRRACDENWSETRVKELLGTRRTAEPRPHKIGGIPKVPASLSEALARWRRRADESIRYASTVFRAEVVTQLVDASDPTPVTIEQFEALRARVKEVRKAVADELKVLDRIIAHLEKARPQDVTPPNSPTKPGPTAAGSSRGTGRSRKRTR